MSEGRWALNGYRVKVRATSPDDPFVREVTLVLGDDGVVYWEPADTEGSG